jgi:hypothetical protein
MWVCTLSISTSESAIRAAMPGPGTMTGGAAGMVTVAVSAYAPTEAITR